VSDDPRSDQPDETPSQLPFEALEDEDAGAAEDGEEREDGVQGEPEPPADRDALDASGQPEAGAPDLAEEPRADDVPHGLVEPPDLTPAPSPAIPRDWALSSPGLDPERTSGREAKPIPAPESGPDVEGEAESRALADREPEAPPEAEPEPEPAARSEPTPEPETEPEVRPEPAGSSTVAAVSTPLGPQLPLPRPLIPDAAVVLTVLVTLTFLMFLLTEPTQRWIALLAVVIAALGSDGVLRSARGEAFALGVDTTPQLFLPALYALALPVFIEHNARGFWVVPSGLAAGVGFGAILIAEIHTVREHEARFEAARIFSAGAAYLTAFAFLSLSYTFDLDLVPAVVAAAIVAGLLSIEVLRDAALDPLDTLTFAAVGALVVGELRWALHFVPLDGHMAALALVLALFFTSGVLYSHLHRQLTREVLLEYVVVVGAGVALVVAARAADLA